MSGAPVLARSAAAIASGRPWRLVCHGSSTTEGYGASDPARTGYPAQLAARLRARVPGGIVLANHGISGENAAQMDLRLPAVLAERPDLVIWQTGSNDATAPDAATPAALARFRALTGSGIAAIGDLGADLVLMDQQFSANLETAPALPAYRAALHDLAARHGVPVYPRYAIMRGWVEAGRATIDAMSPDGTHMTDTGYAWLAESLAEWLRPLLGLDGGIAAGSRSVSS